MKVKFILLSLFILGGLGITACSSDIQNYTKDKKSECFDNGGIEFQSGISGGASRYVCIWRKP